MSAADRPLIGVTTYMDPSRSGVWDVRATFLPQSYTDAVLQAGAIPVLLPPQPCEDGQALAAIERLDGLILTGGSDVDPRRYGAEPHERTGAPREDRDAWESALYDAARELAMPILGICRGLQVINVHGGGTLIQHLPDVVGSDAYRPGDAVFGTGTIDIDPDSRLAGIIGTERQGVPVYHHQGIDRVAEGLRVTARTADGVIQAVEPADETSYLVAVQWHPEEQREDRRLFISLVAAARSFREAQTSLAPALDPPPSPDEHPALSTHPISQERTA